MRQTETTKVITGRGRPLVALLVVAGLAVGAAAVFRVLDVVSPSLDPVAGGDLPTGAVTAADGVLPEGATVFDDRYPGVANLDATLLQALRTAAAAAAQAGVTFYVSSGWRSPAYQDQLLREAIVEHGSSAAARWVATSDKSLHVTGQAADIVGFDAQEWLSAYGAAYGLCQVYANEPWHYEWRSQAASQGCPGLYPDPTADPRLG
ncbi:MAG: D-alanyl-D-alanine carboxypeptidase family protein [Propionibacteriaceae bacterium]|jgi:hypothetical protein|nr:D-alanyl-D-alanine carboxypeptidase family protein [Propionibacteriaceae bacterium]